ncbi:MAG: hypothetical protein QG656_1892, partial [Candidatus Hydrogenedentes bacterium]|nr:hypothetical protein [Candidatus Hydrogenedentota bacterium]
MSHTVNPDREYRLLQQRLDRNVTGAPDSPAFTRILELLFSPEEAKLAQRIPSQPIPVRALAKTLGMPEDELDGKIVDMARRGIVIDFEHKGRRYCLLAPVVIGFFEFTFMRAHDDLPMVELSRLFEEYM